MCYVPCVQMFKLYSFLYSFASHGIKRIHRLRLGRISTYFYCCVTLFNRARSLIERHYCIRTRTYCTQCFSQRVFHKLSWGEGVVVFFGEVLTLHAKLKGGHQIKHCERLHSSYGRAVHGFNTFAVCSRGFEVKNWRYNNHQKSDFIG